VFLAQEKDGFIVFLFEEPVSNKLMYQENKHTDMMLSLTEFLHCLL